MRHIPHVSALHTDLYELTMSAAYLDDKKAEEPATFDLFIRSLPQDWGYLIAAGVEEALDYITNIRFKPRDIEYLKGLGPFSDRFLKYLSQLKFTGDVQALREGTPFTAGAPIVRVTAPRPEAQIIESALLNIINFQTLIASKASRIVNAAGEAKVVDFGLRRAHGLYAGLEGAKAAYMAGAAATSNVEAGSVYGIPLSGTMAHSFIMGYEDEVEAFAAYSRTFPSTSTFLIDTYDTLQGARNAVKVAKEMESRGVRLIGVRLDSGNIKGLSIEVRRILDEAGLDYVKIVASSDLNEYRIDEFRREGAPIDVYGVGTEMITAKPVAALPGVYKLVEDVDGPKMKLSESKMNYPGLKQVYRVADDEGNYLHDVLTIDGDEGWGEPLLEPAILKGARVRRRPTLKDSRSHCLACVAKLPCRVRGVKVVEPYELRISPRLMCLLEGLARKYSVEE